MTKQERIAELEAHLRRIAKKPHKSLQDLVRANQLFAELQIVAGGNYYSGDPFDGEQLSIYKAK